jgi:hypothetical protein
VTPPVRRVTWKPSWRIIPSRFPPIQLFERVADPADLEAVIAVESLTNDRLRDEVGNISLVPREDRVNGPGTSIIMDAFTHLNPDGSRFTNGTYGVFYTGGDLETAISETRYGRERFMQTTSQARMELDMRVYLVDLDADLHDIRNQQSAMPAIYSSDDYSGGQRLARTLRAAGSNGIVYSSVRNPDGECAAVFRPRLLSNARQERHLCYVWNGRNISYVYEKRMLN